VPSPHDAAGRLEGLPPQVEAAGLLLAHETPGGSDDVLWLTGFPAPTLLRASETLRETRSEHASGDLYAPLVYIMPEGRGASRRVFLGPGRMDVPEGAVLACPGSVAVASQSPHGGAVMAWDEASREMTVVTFDAEGRRLRPRKPRILVYC